MVFLKGGLGAGNRAFENGAGHGFNIGAAMLYNIPAPLLKPRRVRAQSSKSQLVRRTLTTQHRGGNGFFVILVPHFNFKFRPRFWTYEYKNRAPFLKPIAYIYIYISAFRPICRLHFRHFSGLRAAVPYRGMICASEGSAWWLSSFFLFWAGLCTA